MLGVGSTATLAAWTDEEHASGEFTAGSFSIVGSTNGVDFGDQPNAPEAALDFAVNPGSMVPGTTVYALYSVKTAENSVAGSVRLSAGESNQNELGKYLSYGVNAVAGITCDAASFSAGTPVLAVNSPLTDGSGASLNLAAAGTTTINFCFAVTLPKDASNDAQGTDLTATWAFAATTDRAGN